MRGVAVQQVRTLWTTASRGGAGAARRNAAPVAFAWPTPDAPLHVVTQREREQFAPRSAVAAELPPELVDEFDLRERDGRLTLLPRLDPWWMPRRHRRPPRAAVEPGAWLRWSVNYRLGLDSGWEYGLLTLNVAYGVADVGELFLGEPPRAVAELAALR